MFYETADALALALKLAAREPYMWASESGVTNPLTDKLVDKVMVANASTSTATMRIGLVYDSNL